LPDDFEDHFIQILFSVIQPKLGLFEVQEEGFLVHAPLKRARRDLAPPGAFYTVDMSLTPGEFITAMIDLEVFTVPDINQAIITAPSI